MYYTYIYIYRILWLSPLRTFHDALYCLLLVFQTAVVHAQSETNQFAIQFVLPFNEGLVYNFPSNLLYRLLETHAQCNVTRKGGKTVVVDSICVSDV